MKEIVFLKKLEPHVIGVTYGSEIFCGGAWVATLLSDFASNLDLTQKFAILTVASMPVCIGFSMLSILIENRIKELEGTK